MLNNKQLNCIDLMITTDKKQKEIAKQISVAESTIIDWKKDAEFKEELETQTRKYFKELARQAQKVMRELLKDKNSSVRFQASKDILDRAGYKPIEQVQNINPPQIIIERPEQ